MTIKAKLKYILFDSVGEKFIGSIKIITYLVPYAVKRRPATPIKIKKIIWWPIILYRITQPNHQFEKIELAGVKLAQMLSFGAIPYFVKNRPATPPIWENWACTGWKTRYLLHFGAIPYFVENRPATPPIWENWAHRLQSLYQWSTLEQTAILYRIVQLHHRFEKIEKPV